MSSGLGIHSWGPEWEARARSFLSGRYATSMFLLGNLEALGPVLGESLSSGNFRVISSGPQVVAVYSLTRRGNLLISAEPDLRIPGAVLASCAGDGISIRGVLGGWEAASDLWGLARRTGAVASESFAQKELLYQLSSLPDEEAVSEVRLLTGPDFAQWLPLRRAYTAEEGLTEKLTDESLRQNFFRYAGMQEFWGLFREGRLVSTAALNARALDIGQVGGVYTVPALRRQGLSRLVMRKLLCDSRRIHRLRRMILFTGEKNLPAQRMYEGLGFERIGHFGVFFA